MFESLGSILLQVLTFFAVLSVLVLIHELGHFTAAKLFNIKVEEFGFGLPPRLFGKKHGETTYSVNALPIGGFVKLYGEEGEVKVNSQPTTHNPQLLKRAFYTRPVWQRAIVLVAGVTMNFLLALVILSYLFTQGVFVPAKRVHIQSVVDNSPAHEAGLKVNDIILSLNNQPVESSEQLVSYTRKHLGEPIDMTILRGADFDKPITEGACTNCQELRLTAVPRIDAPEGQGPMGIGISSYEERVYSITEAPVKGIQEALSLSWALVKGLGITLYKAITLQAVGQDVAGPIGIYKVTGDAVKFGVRAVLELLGLLSLNLAIINILPFPALDGGRLAFVAFEAVTRKKIKLHHEQMAHQIGMIILLALILLITINDILKSLGKV